MYVSFVIVYVRMDVYTYVPMCECVRVCICINISIMYMSVFILYACRDV